MTRMTRSALPLVSLLLIGCAAQPGRDQLVDAGQSQSAVTRQPDAADRIPTAQAENPALAIEAEGLRLFDPASGASRALAFGMTRADLLAALAFRGPPGVGTNTECGAGPLDYASGPDGLTLYFQGGIFAGWALDGRAGGALTTAAGIGPGSTRAALEAAYDVTVEKTTLGTEFTAGSLAGLLDGSGPEARVMSLWAGVNCVFR